MSGRDQSEGGGRPQGEGQARGRDQAARESEENEKGIKMKIKRTKSGRQEIVKSEAGSQNGNSSGSESETTTGNGIKSTGNGKGGSRDVSPARVKASEGGEEPMQVEQVNGSCNKGTLQGLSNNGLHQLTTSRLKVGILKIVFGSE